MRPHLFGQDCRVVDDARFDERCGHQLGAEPSTSVARRRATRPHKKLTQTVHRLSELFLEKVVHRYLGSLGDHDFDPIPTFGKLFAIPRPHAAILIDAVRVVFLVTRVVEHDLTMHPRSARHPHREHIHVAADVINTALRLLVFFVLASQNAHPNRVSFVVVDPRASIHQNVGCHRRDGGLRAKAHASLERQLVRRYG